MFVCLFVCLFLIPLPGYELIRALYYPSCNGGGGGSGKGDAVVSDLVELPQHTPGKTMETTKTMIKAADLGN